MKKITLVLYFVVIVLATELSAQWSQVTFANVGISGKIHAYQDNLFLYGVHHIYRSTDVGNTWSDITSSFLYEVYSLFNYNGQIFAVTTALASGIYRFYVSADGGATWAEKSNIQGITGDGAILGMSSDGNKLFALSSRKSYYTSTDDGLSWNETLINTTATGIGSFAAVGNLHVGVLPPTGALVSIDAGQTWTVKNPSATISNVISYKGNIYGTTTFAGVYKYDITSESWVSVSTGLPDASSFQFTKQLFSYGDALFYYSVGFLNSIPAIFTSQDEGATWIKVSVDGLPAVNLGSSNSVLAATSANLFLYDFNSSTSVASGYKFANPVSGVEEKTVPLKFQLSQNYPNPFNPSTVISWQLAVGSNVTLKVYDVLGKEVATLANENQPAGNYEVKFDGSLLSSGVYFYKLQSGNLAQTKKFILMK